MSKINLEAASTRKRVRDTSTEVEPDEPKIKISATTKKTTGKKVSADSEDGMEIVTEGQSKARGKGKTAANKKKEAAKIKQSIVDKKTKHAAAVSSVVYLGHIPHGFYEKEITRFFSQFGEIKRVKLFRSEKTKGSKGYAFIQFAEHDVAQTAASSMDGYFLSERQLVCQLIPPSKLHRGMFARLKVKPEETQEETPEDSELATSLEPEEIEMTEEMKEKKAKNYLKNQNSKQRKLKAMGIDFDLLAANTI
jgi:nucleolar protein 15